MGVVLRGIHHWGAGAMVLAVFVHLASNFFSASFKAPRQVTWIVGVCLFLVTLGLGFTGYLLPWDLKAYWATVVSTNIPRDIPLVGEAISRVMRGGETVSGMTLTRFYAVHMLLLPAAMIFFTGAHVYLVRVHGIAAPESDGRAGPADVERRYRFFPEHTFRSVLVFAAVFVAIVALAMVRGVAREAVAGTLTDSYLPRPEWYFMWLFQLLTFFSGRWESVGSLAIPAVVVALLFAVPFLDRSTLTRLGQRPLAMAIGASCAVAIVYLTLMGFEGARPHGELLRVPARPLTALEARGLYLFADRDCSYCHHISGRGGHRVGPDLANVAARNRTRDDIVRYIRDPQSVRQGSSMPRYELPQADLEALAAFTLALDFRNQPSRTIERGEALKSSPPVPAQSPAPAPAQ
jgi:ubiquinol-cytochrome c reductase cytochrome b subunit